MLRLLSGGIAIDDVDNVVGKGRAVKGWLDQEGVIDCWQVAEIGMSLEC